MTVSSAQSYIEYNGDGVTKTFPIPYYFLLKTDIAITTTNLDGYVVTLINGTDYTVVGEGSESGGASILNVAPASGLLVTIYRDPPVTQETQYYENGKFPAKSHEKALDKLTMILQSLIYKFNAFNSRAVKVPESGNWVAPSIATRRNTLFAWDDSGRPISVIAPSGSASDVLIQMAKVDGESLTGGATYAQIRASNVTGNQIKCLGRSSNRDGGEGWFFLDASDTTTADDDGTVLVDSVGRRWKRSYDGPRKGSWFGVISSGTDISSNLSNALNIGLGQVEVKDGQYNSYTKITLNPYNGGASYPVAGRVSSRVDLVGGSMHNTSFNTNGNDFIEAIYGGTIASQAVATFATWEKFNVYGPSTAAGVGLRITGAANFLLDRVSLTKLSTGAALTGFLSGDVKNCVFRACSLQGLYLATGGNSTVNAITIENNRFYDHLNLGIFGTVGAGAHIVGNNFEHIGSTNGAAGQGGINLTVTEPMSVVTIDHNWFEGNSGESDVTITNASNGTITVNISGNIFIRGAGGNYCTNNLKFANSGATGRIRVVFGDGNEFYTFATDGYTPDPSRPFISGDGRVIYVGLENCIYNETTSKGNSVVGYCSQVISGNINSSGALLAAPPRFTSSKVTTGVYSIISSETLSNSTDSIMCVATSRDAGVIIQRAVAVSTVEVRVYTTNISGTATDGSFNFMITTSR